MGNRQWLEITFDRTGQKELDQTFISSACLALKPVLARFNAFNLKLLAGLNAILLAEFGGQDDLPFT